VTPSRVPTLLPHTAALHYFDYTRYHWGARTPTPSTTATCLHRRPAMACHTTPLPGPHAGLGLHGSTACCGTTPLQHTLPLQRQGGAAMTARRAVFGEGRRRSRRGRSLVYQPGRKRAMGQCWVPGYHAHHLNEGPDHRRPVILQPRHSNQRMEGREKGGTGPHAASTRVCAQRRPACALPRRDTTTTNQAEAGGGPGNRRQWEAH